MVEGLSTERSPLLNVETEPRMWKGVHSFNVLSAVRSLLLKVETEPKFSIYPVSFLCVDSFTFPDIYLTNAKKVC